jgi:hypothetical protein
VKSKITHVHVVWPAPAAGQPMGYYDEIDANRWSIRCMREFGDGTVHAFKENTYNWRDVMPETAIPLLDDINNDPQFKARHISKTEFEALWVQHYGLNQFSMIAPLLEVLPEFRPQWDRFVAGWKNNPHNTSKTALPLYLVLSDFASFLVTQLEQGQVKKFPAIFEIIEHWLAQGDAYVKNAAGAGLLEDLLNPVRYQKRKPNDFASWMRPVTLKCWKRLKLP